MDEPFQNSKRWLLEMLIEKRSTVKTSDRLKTHHSFVLTFFFYFVRET